MIFEYIVKWTFCVYLQITSKQTIIYIDLNYNQQIQVWILAQLFSDWQLYYWPSSFK